MSLLAALVMALVPCAVTASSPRRLVEDGNAAYASGKFDDALKAYEEAAAALPGSPEISYNRGAVEYRKGAYDKAAGRFRDAAAQSGDPRLDAMSQYNLGNCAFREGERVRTADLEKSLSSFQESAECYQRAQELDPDLKDAAYNKEVARLAIRQVMEEMKQRQQQEQQRQKASDKLKELVQKQQEAVEKNKQLSEEMRNAQPQDQQQMQEKAAQQAREQQALQKETKELAEQMGQNQPQDQQAGQAKQNLEKAAGEQGTASEKLRQGMPEQARGDQEEAAKDLQKALDSMGREKEGEQKKDGAKKEENKQGSGEKKETPEQAPQQQQAQAGKEPGEDKTGLLPEEARDILEEEKLNREQRDTSGNAGYKPVDKDW